MSSKSQYKLTLNKRKILTWFLQAFAEIQLAFEGGIVEFNENKLGRKRLLEEQKYKTEAITGNSEIS